MAFTDSQLRKLREKVKAHHIKAREAEGITLHYLEGWHVIAEANRIFGFEGWDRETVHSQCVWTKQMGSRFTAAYILRIKVIVRAGDIRILREGSGAGEATAATPGQAHELALKAAETDATKRALSTFGNAFGLSLYGSSGEDLRRRTSNGATQGPPGDRVVHNRGIDKSLLLRSEPKRLRDQSHLRRVGTLPCLICGRKPTQTHHLTFPQPRALGRKSSDENAVPLCNLHHRELHERGDEPAWWIAKNIDPVPIAQALWSESQGWSIHKATERIPCPEPQSSTVNPETAES
jgi:hypothetical protein